LDLIYSDPKLFAGNLADGNPKPLAEINLAAEHRNGAVAVHGEKGIHIVGIERPRCSRGPLG